MTNQAIAITRPTSTEIVAFGMSRDQLDLLKRTVAEGTTDDEFALFMTTANRLGLDPFTKQIYAVKRKSWNARLQREVEKMVIQTGIDGFRSVADRTGENDGQEGPFWCGKDRVWHEVWVDREPPIGAMLRAFRKGCSKAFTGVATLHSYAQTNQGKPVGQWGKMPDVMLAKCAEALALRKAFPAQLSGVYVREEMDQADRDPKPENRSQPSNDQRSTTTVIDVPPAAEKPAEPADVALEREWQSLSVAIVNTKSIKDLEGLFNRYQSLPKGSRVRGSAYELINQQRDRLAAIAAQEAATAPEPSAPAFDDDIPF